MHYVRNCIFVSMLLLGPCLMAQSNSPIISNISDSKAKVWSNGFEAVDNDATISDPDSTQFTGGALLVRVARGLTTDELSFSTEVAPGKPYAVGRLIYMDRKVIGSFPTALPLTGPAFLRINFRPNLTPEVATKILRSITYRNNSSVETTGNRTLQFRVLDGSGGVSALTNKVIVLIKDNPAPTISNLSYGPNERQQLDLWKAPGDTPRPVIVFIHGGGWYSSDKSLLQLSVANYLQEGISVARINYRYSTMSPLPTPVHDAARAIQWLRSRARELNIDSSHIAVSGSSAGGCSALWLLLHDDLANPSSPDPVLRQSSRVSAGLVSNVQTSISPEVLHNWIGPVAQNHPMIHLSVGEPTSEDLLANIDSHRATLQQFSPINHLDANDPPVFLIYSPDDELPARDSNRAIHHPEFGRKLHAKSRQVGHECHLYIPGESNSPVYVDTITFLKDNLFAK